MAQRLVIPAGEIQEAAPFIIVGVRPGRVINARDVGPSVGVHEFGRFYALYRGQDRSDSKVRLGILYSNSEDPVTHLRSHQACIANK